MFEPPSDGVDGGGGPAGVGDLHFSPSEHSLAAHHDHAYYGPLSGGGETTGTRVYKRWWE